METIQENQAFPGGKSVFVKNKLGIKKETNKMEISQWLYLLHYYI